MVNFKGAMAQVNQTCGVMRVFFFHTAKELQLEFSSDSHNIFLGLGSFHTTKIIIKCLGQYLEGSGIVEALTETQVFGPKMVESILKGNHHSREVRDMDIIAEALQRIQVKEFFSNTEDEKYQSLFDQLRALEVSCVEKDPVAAKKVMEDTYDLMQTLNTDFMFIKKGEEKYKVFFSLLAHFPL